MIEQDKVQESYIEVEVDLPPDTSVQVQLMCNTVASLAESIEFTDKFAMNFIAHFPGPSLSGENEVINAIDSCVACNTEEGDRGLIEEAFQAFINHPLEVEWKGTTGVYRLNDTYAFRVGISEDESGNDLSIIEFLIWSPSSRAMNLVEIFHHNALIYGKRCRHQFVLINSR